MAAIVLAAGSGRRFGGGKLMAPWAGGVLLEGALNAAFSAPASVVVVVTGADVRIAAAARDFAERIGAAAALKVVNADDHDEGMAASLRTGVSALPADCGGAFIFLGDMPSIPPEILPQLARALNEGATAAAPLFKGERGHPVLLSRRLFEAVLALKGDQGARAVLADLGGDLVMIPSENSGVIFDVDHPEALIAP